MTSYQKTPKTIEPFTSRFALNEDTKIEINAGTPEFGFNGIGEVVFRRTYSRGGEDWAAVVIRVVQGVMSIRKEHYFRNSLRWDDDEMQPFAREMALSLFKMEWLPPGRGLWMMGTDFVYERGSMALNNCFKRSTTFWTDKGLRSFEDFEDGDQVIIRGKNKWMPATIKCFDEQELVELTVSKKGHSNTIYTTNNHRWLANYDGDRFEIKTTIELKQGFSLQNTDDLETRESNEYWIVDSVKPTGIIEKVWCVVEPEFEEFTLECGILTKNCSATDTKDDFVHSAEWTMDGLMNGVGVGFSTNWRGIAEKPDKSDSEVFVIPDSREGWVESLIRLMCAYIDSPRYGKNKFPVFDYSIIRGSGIPIKGFGGQSSGPDPLKKMHSRIEGYLDAFCDGFLRVDENTTKRYSHTRLVADVFNAIGACVVAGNVRRCLPGTSMVHTSKGIIPITEVSVGDEVLTMNGYEKVANKFVQGRQKLIKIVTQDGDFRCTPNHRMAVCSSYNEYKWKEASQLETGDRLISSRFVTDGQETKLPSWEYVKPVGSTTCKDITIPELDEDMAWLIGLFQGDGYTYPNYASNGFNAYVSIVGGLNEYDVMEKAKAQLERFGKDLHVPLKKRKNENSFQVSCQSKQLAWYLDKHVKQANTTIRVPEWIMKAKPSIRLAFVAGVTDADGCLKNRPVQVLSTVYEPFARDIQILLYSCGVESRLVHYGDQPSRVGWQPLYAVNLITKRSQRIFADIPQLHKEMRQSGRSQNANGFPVTFETNPKSKTKFGLYSNSQFNIDAYDRHYGECSYTPVEVVSVVEDTDEETYDIEVENSHEFFCDGYLTHNSAEICLGDVNDDDFVNLKNYTLNPERGEIGWMSNNSVMLKSDDGYNDFSYIPDMAARIRDNGEPGMINHYNMQKYGRYGKEQPDEATLVNPCFSGDTMIATADGRGAVSIKQLADEGKDIPVYSLDEVTKEISIQWGRHPRVTGTNQKLIRIHFDGKNKDEFMDVTPNHKFLLNDGRVVQANQLAAGDSLPQFKKGPNGIDDYVVVYSNGKRLVEHRMVAEFHDKQAFNQTVYNGCCKTIGVVVHHKDENKMNNHPDNLEITTASDHNRIHNQEYVGEGNPMYGKQHSDYTKRLIGEKCKMRCNDPDYRKKLSDAQTPEMRDIASTKMSDMRKRSITELYDRIEQENVGLVLNRISPTELSVSRTCENEQCGLDFSVSWSKREQSYCCVSCSNRSSIEARKVGQSRTLEEKAKINFHNQAMLYKDLVNPDKKAFKNACKENNISCRFNANSENPWIASGWTHFKQMVDDYNHRVSSVEELEGEHTVYNITVDVNHTLAVVTKMNDDFSRLIGAFTYNCGEICLENYELCNLSEVFPTRCDDSDRFYHALRFATFYASTVSLLPTHRPETNAVIAKNRRIGVSISGIAQWASGEVPKDWGIMNYTNITRYLRKAYGIVKAENALLAKKAGVPASVRVTTIKPSGSISLLAGATPGIHYPVSRYAIRRMRIGNDSPLVPALKEAGVPNEPDTYSDNTLVFEFAIDHGNVRPCEQVSPWEQFSLVAMMQRCYSDNCVSATVYFDKEKDGPDVEKLLAMFIPVLKSVSMLPHSGHGYAQAPYEPIDKEEYERRKNSYTIPDFNKVKGNVPVGSKFCSGDTCEL